MTAFAQLDRDIGASAVASYSVSTWDHETNRWDIRDSHVTKWGLRCWLRRLYAESWDQVSILIKRNEP